MEFWRKGSLTSLLLPPGILLLAVVFLVGGGWLLLPPALVSFYFYAVFAAGLLLAWRFHSSRVVFALLVLLLSQRALEFFSRGPALPPAGSGRIAFELISLLLPINLVIFGALQERGVVLLTVAPRLLAIFVESVFVAVLCRPDQETAPVIFRYALLNPQWFHWTQIPQLSLLVFALAAAFLFWRFLQHRKPVEGGLFWAVLGSFLALQWGAIGRIPQTYMATAGLVLVIAIIETSYSMAYNDELTGLPARRAFNEALLALPDPYTVAIVDIDHFKQFNDTYGHDTGDQVLRLVASKLAQVTGGGQPFRCGGEEFAILFPGMSLQEATPHLEAVRQSIETAAFRVRAGERRFTPRKNDRRKVQVRRGRLSRSSSRPFVKTRGALSVTVSIGVAEPSTRIHDIDQVIDAADQALYRAKANGRNRLEVAAGSSS